MDLEEFARQQRQGQGPSLASRSPRSSASVAPVLYVCLLIGGVGFAVYAGFSSGDYLGWAIWGILAFFAATWSYGVIQNLQAGSGITSAMIGTVATWWVLLIWTAVDPGVQKLHLLWVAPSAILVANFLPFVLLILAVIALLFFLS